ncbi:SIMPL domain-containing protein [Christensenellaceae bacterium OttesenSCG-928-L17]|nr:SIMPL domain-containing protein [Christensenellaceae bacterium OttesenSCG-928-L17]
MKRKTIAVIAAILVLALAAGCTATPPAQTPVSVVDDTGDAVGTVIPTVTVSGTGELEVDPDMATVTFAVRASGKATAEEATAEVSKLMDDIKAALIALGVEEKDMQTSGYYMYEDYSYDGNGNRVGKPKYSLDNNLTVKIYDIDLVAGAIDAATGAGATNVYGVYFGLKDRLEKETEALSLAFENAKARAEKLAEISGKKLGEVLLLSDSTQMTEQVYRSNDMVMAESSMDTGASITHGTLTITSTISVRFTME